MEVGASALVIHSEVCRFGQLCVDVIHENRQQSLIRSLSLLQHALSGHAKVKPFDPKITCKQECLITTFQDVYFVSESFEDAKEKMR